MVRRSLVLGIVLLGGGAVVAKPPGGPVDPHGSGKEPTPVEREFHLAAPNETALTQAVPVTPRRTVADPAWPLVRLLLPWVKGG